MSPSIYLVLKGLHVAAAVAFTGGLLAGAIGLASLQGQVPTGPAERRLVAALRRLDRTVSGPALSLVWVLGIVLAWQGGWTSAHWLWGKLLLVLALSALHGNQAGALRRLAAEPPVAPSRGLRRAAPWIVVAVAAIALLATVKPG